MIARVYMVDAWRGLAIAGVVLFHFVWDLEFTGFISGVAYHPLWLGFGRVLAGSFVMLVGVSLALSSRSPFRPSAYLLRLTKIGVAAAAITLVTWYVFPATFIYFGILHAIAVATLVGTLFQRTPWWLSLASGVGMLVVPSLWQSELFDTRWLAWIGFAQNVPPSNDFVPIFPWVGITLIGMSGAKVLVDKGKEYALDRLVPAGRHGNKLAWMGRHSLTIYLLHQPIMLGIIIPLARYL
ncbi:heparan-alpha-glucosaminide N-acetyltransferase [Ochrobactrum sp. WV_118_8]|nr:MULTISPECIES: heparan-alpha-glucosaminide N-acetyltransferase [Hyphomicrobiales]WKT92969.1 heparan-alpha-glucosaminide N-acetyltransferase [Brucella anthropi]